MTNANPQQIESFNDNPLIKRLSKIPQWTISDNQKAPLNIQSAIDSNFKRPLFFSYKRSNNLTALDKFDSLVPDTLPNRAIRLDTKLCRIFAIDIEPNYDHNRWDKWLRWLPVDYIEYSTHDGYHILVNLTEGVYDDHSVQEFINNHTDVQFLEKGKSHQGIEFVFNKHFMTLTRRVVLNKQDYPFQPYPAKNQKQQAQWLIKFLSVINKMNNSAHVSLNLNRDILAKIDDQTKEQAKIVKTYITKEDIIHAKETATKNATKNTGELDLSRVEWRFLSSIYGYYKQVLKNTAYLISLEQQLQITDSDKLLKVLSKEALIATVLTMIAQENLTPREKWNTKRQEIPWLLSNSLKVIQYFNSQDKKK